jgi:hypothetical protein
LDHRFSRRGQVYGRLAVATGGWKDEYLEVIGRKRVEALAIGVPDDDLSFLGQLTDLRGLTLNSGSVRQLANLQALTKLEDLTLNTPTDRKCPWTLAPSRSSNGWACTGTSGSSPCLTATSCRTCSYSGRQIRTSRDSVDCVRCSGLSSLTVGGFDR